MKKALTLVGLIGLILLGLGLYLGHKTIGKLEQSHAKIISEKENMINELKEQIQTKEAELTKIKQEKTIQSTKVEEPVKKEDTEQSKLIQELLSQSQKNLLLEEEIKNLSGKMTELVEKCTIKPLIKKPIVTKKSTKSVYHVEKTQVKPIEKPLEKKIEPMTIIINKVYVTDKGGQQKLIKSEKKVIPKTYYPNDLLK